MKTKLFLYTLLFVCIGSLLLANDATLRAEKAYSNKNYKQAVELYQSLVKAGYTSFKLHYNLGNAYYKNNEIGKAIYHYELARTLEPNNEDVKNNLRLANDKAIDKIESKENFFISAIKSGVVNLYTTTQWAWISIAFFILSLVFVLIFIVTKIMLIKKLSFFICSIFSLIFVLSLLLGFSALSEKSKVNFAIVVGREAKIKEEPSESASSKFSLHEGAKVKVLETNITWTNIKLENGNEGWIKTTSLGLIS